MRKLQQRFGHPKKFHLDQEDTVTLEVDIGKEGRVEKEIRKHILVSEISKYVSRVFQCTDIISGKVDRIRFEVLLLSDDRKKMLSALYIEWREDNDSGHLMNNILDVRPRYINTEILEAIFECFGIEEGEYLSKGIYLTDAEQTYQISNLVTSSSGLVHGGAWRVLSEGFNMIFRSLIPHEEYLRKYKKAGLRSENSKPVQ